MKNPKFPVNIDNLERRSGFNRRWIKSHYNGKERRSGLDRRKTPTIKKLPVPENYNSNNMAGFKKLLISNTIQLEAVTRILLEKGIVEKQELLKMIQNVQSEYQNHTGS